MSGNAAIEQIKERIDLVALVGKKVTLKKSGPNAWNGLCPFHNEKTGSFYVYTDSNRYVCFSCSEKGDCFDWMERQEGLSFIEALQTLAAEAGVDVPKAEKPLEDEKVEEKRTLLMKVGGVYSACLEQPAGKKAREYLQSREIHPDIWKEFGLGYAPTGPSWLADRAKDLKALEDAGIILPSTRQEDTFIDRFRNRVIFPLHDELGRLVGFSGRILSDKSPKYLNSAQSEIFDKGAIIYNLHRAKKAIRRQGEVLVFEGYTDVIMAHQNDITHSVATMGTAMTERQAQMLATLKVRIVLCLDGDEAGQLASERGIRNLRTSGVPVQDVYVVALPGKEDPAAILARDKGTFQALIKEDQQIPLVRFLIERFAGRDKGDAALKSIAVARIGPFIRGLPDPIERDFYLTMLANSLGISRKAIDEAVDERKPLGGVQTPVLMPFGRTEPLVASSTIRQVDRELYFLGMYVKYPETARNFLHLGHQNLFGELLRGMAWNNIKDTLKHYPEINTTERFVDEPISLEWQNLYKQAVDEVNHWRPTNDTTTWLSEVNSTLVLLKAQRSKEYKDFLVGKINAAIAAGDKDEAKRLVEALAIGWQM